MTKFIFSCVYIIFSISTDLITSLLVRQTFSIKEPVTPVCVKVGSQTYYIPPVSIIYLQSNRHKTVLYCVDKVLECSMLITNIFPMLPNNFCFVRRGCIVNAMYVTSIRRCEVELIFKIRIQIPVPSYITVKEELNARIMYEKKLSNFRISSCDFFTVINLDDWIASTNNFSSASSNFSFLHDNNSSCHAVFLSMTFPPFP